MEQPTHNSNTSTKAHADSAPRGQKRKNSTQHTSNKRARKVVTKKPPRPPVGTREALIARELRSFTNETKDLEIWRVWFNQLSSKIRDMETRFATFVVLHPASAKRLSSFQQRAQSLIQELADLAERTGHATAEMTKDVVEPLTELQSLARTEGEGS